MTTSRKRVSKLSTKMPQKLAQKRLYLERCCNRSPLTHSRRCPVTPLPTFIRERAEGAEFFLSRPLRYSGRHQMRCDRGGKRGDSLS
ncbi:hypothetical protein CEXT_197201, partial [Caerostris extrusa]